MIEHIYIHTYIFVFEYCIGVVLGFFSNIYFNKPDHFRDAGALIMFGALLHITNELW